MAKKTFDALTSKPSKSNKYIYLYNNSKNGGKSYCINGKPTDSTCNVLCNCVGWACGRFNHIYNLLTGYDGIKYPLFCCNAENFIEVAKKYGLTVSQTPEPGAIMCWQKGATLSNCDGAGHVAIVEKVISNTKVYTSESGYNCYSFKNYTREKGTGNWGAGSCYKFRGFILNPAVDKNTEVNDCGCSKQSTSTNTSEKKSTIKKTNPVERNKKVNQIKIIIENLNVRKSASKKSVSLGFAKLGYYNYTECKKCDGYTWYKIGPNNWVAYSEKWIKILKRETPASSPCTNKTLNIDIKIGDRIKLAKNAKVYGKTYGFAPWVYNSDLYIRNISGNQVTISINKTGAITGSTDKKYIVKQ